MLIFERLPIVGRLYTRNASRFPGNVRYGDIVKGLPIPPESCKGIYCSHVLEHLSFQEFDEALENTYACLQRGGTFRLVVPDLEHLARMYLSSTDPMASARFIDDSGLGKRMRPRSLTEFLMEWLGGSRHLWMWDERSIAQKLGDQGFRSIRRASFGDAEDKRFCEVEVKERFGLAMQCSK